MIHVVSHERRVSLFMLRASSTVTQWSGNDKAHAILNANYHIWQKDPNHKYYGKSKQQILAEWTRTKNEAMKLGIRMHELIEAMMRGDLRWISSPEDHIVWEQFTAFLRDHGSLLVPQMGVEVKVEHSFWRMTGRIDFVGFDLERKGYILIDWKRSKASPDTKQLNMYRLLFETKSSYPVLAMYAVLFHPELHHYQLVQVPIDNKELGYYLGKGKQKVLQFHWNVLFLVARFVLKLRRAKRNSVQRPKGMLVEKRQSDWEPLWKVLCDLDPSIIAPWI
jgi:hypothetical protein